MKKPLIPLFRTLPTQAVEREVAKALRSGAWTEGEFVRRFERQLATALDAETLLATSDVGAALTIALRLAGVGPGDAVLMSPMCCLSTSMPVAALGAEPAWCDVDPATGMMDPGAMRNHLTPKVKAILVNHWCGDVAPVEAIAATAREFGLPVVEDASDAFGATVAGRPLGCQDADFTCFSFRGARPLSCGEGGALVLRDAGLLSTAERMRRYGMDPVGFHKADGSIDPESDVPVWGQNGAMGNLAAAVGLGCWESVEEVLLRHIENGVYYDRALGGVPGVKLLRRRADAVSAYWVYTFLSERRDELAARLRARGIVAQPPHVRNDRYSCFAASRRELPGVDEFDARDLAIPCGWWVDDEGRDLVVATLNGGA